MLAAILSMFLPIIILMVGWHYAAKKFPIIKSVSQTMWSILMWLWKEPHEKSGAGKTKPPKIRYFDDLSDGDM